MFLLCIQGCRIIQIHYGQIFIQLILLEHVVFDAQLTIQFLVRQFGDHTVHHCVTEIMLIHNVLRCLFIRNLFQTAQNLLHHQLFGPDFIQDN